MVKALIQLILLSFIAVCSCTTIGTRVLLESAAATGAVCLDGTPGAYYIHPGTGSGVNKWYIHHLFGGWCSSLATCHARSLTIQGSSRVYPPTYNLEVIGGYFSTNATVNPQMYNWNLVLLNYCDGGSFSGNNNNTITYHNASLYFRGFQLLQAMRNDLFDNQGLDVATDVVISGCSAGGLATYLHLDWWRENLSHSTFVVGLPDSGFFLDYDSPGTDYHDQMKWTFENMAAEEGVNQECVAAYKRVNETWRCFFAQYTAPFIRTPLFPLQSIHDSWQVAYDLNSTNATQINDYGYNMTVAIETHLLTPHPRNGIFLDSCSHHCFEWGDIFINGTNQAQAFMEWYDQTRHNDRPCDDRHNDHPCDDRHNDHPCDDRHNDHPCDEEERRKKKVERQIVYFQDQPYPCADCCTS